MQEPNNINKENLFLLHRYNRLELIVRKNQKINEVNTIISEQINEMPRIMISNLGKEIINEDDEKKE